MAMTNPRTPTKRDRCEWCDANPIEFDTPGGLCATCWRWWFDEAPETATDAECKRLRREMLRVN